MKETTKQHLLRLIERYPALEGEQPALEKMFLALSETYARGGKLLLCGNGGSCADSDHIVGELMKSFLFKRQIPTEISKELEKYGDLGKQLAQKLEGALPAISLCTHNALSTAFLNDTEPAMTFAQQVLGYGRPGDTLLAISTSGNSQNCVLAAITARSCGVKVLAFTGKKNSRLAELADITFHAPAEDTYQVQEYHLPAYHCLCAMLEEEIFSNN